MIRPRFLPALLLLLLAFPLAAADEVVTVTPLNPRAGEIVTVSIDGIWPNGCPPRVARVDRNGATISVAFSTAQGLGGCTQALVSYHLTTTVGPLEVGTYDLLVQTLVEVPLVNPPPPAATVLRRQLVVAEAAPALLLSPGIASIHGGSEIAIRRADGQRVTTCTAQACEPVEVRIGGVLATSGVAFPGDVVVVAPPHAAGAVDVTVISKAGTFTVRNGLRYFDPDAPLDPSTHATVLFPLYFNGSGAYGSQWQTTIEARNRNDVSVVPLRPVFPAIPSMETSPIDPRITVRERGVLLHVPRELLPRISFAAFARDLSREAERWGSELPVVHEEAFATELEFVRVPLDRRYRVTLRVYMLDESADDVVVSAYDDLRDVQTGGFRLDPIKRTDIEPAFAIVENLSDRVTGETIRLNLRSGFGVGRFWAFLTVTNNDTQQVTVITPQ